jgi:hypothetical protein
MTIGISTIRDLFQTKIFNHATIQGITTKTFNYDIDISTDKDLNNLKHNQRINFFSYQALRSIDYEITSMNGNANDYGYRYEVQINYYLESENKSESFNQVIDRMEIIENLIHSELGIRWDNTVEVFRQEGNSLPEIITIQDIECWKMTSLYVGLKYN